MTEHNPPLLSVVIPCYNEEKGLPELFHRLYHVCAPYADQGVEIIFINDGSTDATWAEILKIQAKNSNIKGISLSRNFGHAMALTAGLEACSGQRILIIDADLQDPPELLPTMMKKMDDGADVVYGKRINRDGETWLKKATASAYYRLLNFLSDISMPLDTGDFRLINRKVLKALNAMPEQTRYIRGMVAWVGFNQVALEYNRDKRFAGNTHYTISKILRLALDGLTGFSNYPLRLCFYLGFIMLFITFLLTSYVLYTYFTHNALHGWTSLAILILGTQGIQWVILGLLGEYIGRIFQQTKNRPKYLITESIGWNNTP